MTGYLWNNMDRDWRLNELPQRGDCFMKKPIVIAHRGASTRAPENTIAAFKKAVAMGAGGIELDVQMSADGYLVVIHDEKVNRTSNGRGNVRDLHLPSLRSLTLGNGSAGPSRGRPYLPWRRFSKASGTGKGSSM